MLAFAYHRAAIDMLPTLLLFAFSFGGRRLTRHADLLAHRL